MKFHILTLFPDFFESFKNTSIVKKGLDKGIFEVNVKNIRDYAVNTYGQVDDAPYGGGAGMLMRPEPIFDSFDSLDIPDNESKRVIFFTPKGKKMDHSSIIGLTKMENIVLICGHYEGVDQRVVDALVDEEYSIGDFVLTGGELPAMVLVDAVVRQLDGVIKKASLEEESFSSHLLEYRQYTRPASYRGMDVPGVLISGNHKEIDNYRKRDSVLQTYMYRPDLLDFYKDNKEIQKIISNIIMGESK